MKEIKYRGKRLSDGQWAKGTYFNIKRNGFFVGIGHYILPEDSVFGFKVDPETVGQYTGLKDKNGKEIYEKDYVKFGVNTYIVDFRSGCFMFDNVKNGKNDEQGFEIWDTIVCHELMESSCLIEIIGNMREGTK